MVNTAYEMRLNTIEAELLWKGRPRSETTAFIPGVLDFYKVAQRLEMSEEGREKLSGLNKKISLLRNDLRERTDKILDGVKGFNPGPIKIVKKIDSTPKVINFNSNSVRILALLVGIFDELVEADELAVSYQQDLGAEFPFTPGNATKEYKRKIRALLYTAI